GNPQRRLSTVPASNGRQFNRMGVWGSASGAFLLAFSALVSIVNPVGGALIYNQVTARRSGAGRRGMRRRCLYLCWHRRGSLRAERLAGSKPACSLSSPLHRDADSFERPRRCFRHVHAAYEALGVVLRAGFHLARLIATDK